MPSTAEQPERDESGSSGAIQSGKLAGRSMSSAIWVLAAPVLLQQTMTAFVGLTDTVLAGRLPEGAALPGLDAIGIGSYITWFILIAMTGLGVGGQALIARAMGAGDEAQAHCALGQAMLLSLAWGVIVGLGVAALTGPLAILGGLTTDASEMFTTYVRIICLMMPAAAVMLVGAMCLHGAGETTMPSVIAIIVSIVNMVVSWALSGVDVHTPLGFLENPFSFDLGVAGIAGGTAVGYVVGAMLTLAVLVRGVKDLRLMRRDLRPDRRMSYRLIRVGIPGFLDSIMMWSSNFLVLMIIGDIAAGNDGLQGAHLIAIRWESFSFLPGFAIGTAAGALAGQYLGARNTRMARRSIIVCSSLGAVMMGLLGIVFLTCGEWLTRIISDEPIHIAETPPLLAICGMVQIFFAISMVVRQGLRGIGDTRWTFLITTITGWGMRLPAAWFFGVHLGLGLTGVWIGLCGEIVIRALCFVARFMHGGWARVEV